MSRWRRRDAPHSDPDPTEQTERTEQIAVPERSWQRADTAGEPDGTRSLLDDLLAGRAGEPVDSGPAEPAGAQPQPTEWLGVARPEPDGPQNLRNAQFPEHPQFPEHTEHTEHTATWEDPPVPDGPAPWQSTEPADDSAPDPVGATQVVEPPVPGWAPDAEPAEPPAAVGQPAPVDEAGRAAQRASAREEILGRVRAAVGGRPTPDEDVVRGYRRSLDTGRDRVVDLFAERVADYHATVRRIPRDQLAATIAVCLVERGIRRIVVPADLPGSWLPRYVQVSVDHGELTGAELDAVDGVITGCALGVAETGTIVLDGGRLQGRRLLSLVPDYHLCVVDTLDVVGTLPEALAALDPNRPLTFVSGPSATSDIELNRVEGVHGPRTLDVLLTGSL